MEVGWDIFTGIGGEHNKYIWEIDWIRPPPTAAGACLGDHNKLVQVTGTP